MDIHTVRDIGDSVEPIAVDQQIPQISGYGYGMGDLLKKTFLDKAMIPHPEPRFDFRQYMHGCHGWMAP